MLNELEHLHALCFPHKPWSAGDFADLKKSGCDIVASQNGFIVYRVTLDEAELITIGVHPDTRRGGIAATMIELMIRDLVARGVKQVFLEVAENNHPARALYECHGFVTVGRRPKYYDGIDAILMARELQDAPNKI